MSILFNKCGKQNSLNTLSFIKIEVMIKLIKNKYIIAILAFALWMTFFDQNSFVFQSKISKEMNMLSSRKKFYINQNTQLQKQKGDLETNISNLEKLAREKYLMKRDDEDVFVILNEE